MRDSIPIGNLKMTVPFLLCESHPGRLLSDHLIEVANAVGSWRDELWLTGLFHDLGKATSFFQDYVHGRQADARLKAHALFGAFWLYEILRGEGDDPEEQINATLRALFVRRHHGKLDDLEAALTMEPAEKQRCLQRLAATDTDGIAAWLGKVIGRDAVATPTFEVKPLRRVRLSRALDEHLCADAAMRRFHQALHDFGRLINADRGSVSGQPTGKSARSSVQLSRVHLESFRAAGDFGASIVAQKLVAARDKVYHAATVGAAAGPMGSSIWTLEVPTGAGKTLAALGWAVERRRIRLEAGANAGTIFYALPFTSIIDQTAAVLRRLWPAADSPGALAVHHHLSDYGSTAGNESASLARDWAESWNADVVCTTFVQVVHALFHGTTSDARRFAALASGGALILDEAQALPAELWPTLRTALLSIAANFGVDILLLTATQPALLEPNDPHVDLSPRSDSSEVTAVFDRYDVIIENGENWNVTRLIDAVVSVLAGDRTRRPRSGLVVLNTVRDALAVHAAARQHTAFAGWPVLHLSTNLRPKDRSRILANLKEMECSGGPRLLVATQVVEAGVDLSFDAVFRAEAPLDAIVQAAGRCNRHGSGIRGQVLVFRFEGRNAHLIYGDIKMGIARRLLTELASSSADRSVPEPEFVAGVPQFFARVKNAFGPARDKARMVMDAVRRLEFAALRGEADRDKKAKVELIAEDESKTPVFVETDEDDAIIWQRLIEVLNEPDQRNRSLRLRALRAEVGARVVEIPEKLAPSREKVGFLTHISRAEFRDFYDLETGWRRS